MSVTAWIEKLGAMTLDQLGAVTLAAVAWRDAKCPYQNNRGTLPDGRNDWCDGDNHREDCPCEIARQDLIAAVDAARVAGAIPVP